jgi:thiol-disulfide isomerase/thioredoxin
MIKRRNVIQSIVALGVPGSVLPGRAKEAQSPLPQLGAALVLPPVTLLDGQVWMPSDVQGKLLVVYWWASWCPFCAVQSPYVEALWRAHQASGLTVLGLSLDKAPEAAIRYRADKGYSFPAGLLTPAISRVLPKPSGLPVLVVRGRDGRVVFAERGEMLPEDVEGLKKYL